MKIIFKSLLSLLTIIVVFIGVVACGGKNTTITTTGGATGTTDGTTTTGDGITYDLHGATIRILHGAVREIDPFHPDYSGDFQLEKQALQAAVEAKYNCVISYEPYPDDAAWGPNRVQAIINGVLSEDPIGHIYAISSMWIGDLAKAEAIAPVKSYIRDYANEYYDDTMKEFGAFMDEIYGFEVGYVLNDSAGLYYNLDLVQDLGLESPAKMWNEGKWTWADFEVYVAAAQAKLTPLGEGYYALGGKTSVYAQHMVPANGGYLINPDTKRVAFDQTLSLNTFSFLTTLYQTGAWEPTPQFDAGSANWSSGKVLFHPGELWFLNADNRWGLYPFQIGYVPYPMGNNMTMDTYKTGKDSMAMYAVSAGYDDPNGINSEVLFKIWNDLQYWQTFADVTENFQFTLEERYDDYESVEAHLSVLNKIYLEQIFNLGISGHNTENGFYVIAEKAVVQGDANTYLTALKPVYQQKLDEMFGSQ